MIKLTACVLICMFSFLISYELLICEENKARSADSLREAVDKIIVMLHFGEYDVFQICESLFEDGDEFSPLNGDFRKQWIDYCRNHLIYSDLKDVLLFEKVGEVLGSTDAKSQIDRLTYIKDELIRSYENRRTDIEKKRRIYLSLGCFSGLMVCILLI